MLIPILCADLHVKGKEGGPGGSRPKSLENSIFTSHGFTIHSTIVVQRVRDLASEDDEKTQKLLKHSLITEH